MLGHKLCQLYRGRFELYCTVRGRYDSYARYGIFEKDRTFEGIDVLDFDRLVTVSYTHLTLPTH